MDGEIGWMHVALLSRDRMALVTGNVDVEVHVRDDTASEVLAMARPGAIGRLIGCARLACEVEFAGAEGWVARGRLWGIHAGDEF
jgi:SH3-like domain-containing protein